MEEIVVVQATVGGERAIIAEDHIEYIDAIVLLWFAAANVEEVGVVAHSGVWDL